MSEEAKTAQDGQAPELPTPQEPDYLDQLVRLKAEFENFRKRVDREKPEFYKMGKAEVLLRLLPIYDLLQRAHEQILASKADTDFAKGMDGIFKEFQKIFKEEGVNVMAPKGKPYDAQRHEALGTVESMDLEDGTVAEVLQNGFMLQDKVLRTAKVHVARKPVAPDLCSEKKEDI